MPIMGLHITDSYYCCIIDVFQINLGVLQKNEQYNDNMTDFCSFLHQYEPGHDSSGKEAPEDIKWWRLSNV